MTRPDATRAQLQIYEQLLRFQLFQGLSRAELLQMAGNTKFGFLKEDSAKEVAREGTPCRQLHFLVSGSLTVSTRSDDGGYEVSEQLAAPWALQPEALFGAEPRYSSTYRTSSSCHFITLSKDEVLRLVDDFLVIRINMLNILSTIAQRHSHLPWRSTPQTLRERFVRFVLAHTVYPAGRKELRILMQRLADELGDSRLNVSRMLHQLASENMLQMHRGRIVIPLLEHLLQAK